MNYSYQVYGLSVQSEFEMPELKKAKSDPAVSIKFGMVPENLDNVLKSGVAFQVNENEFILHVKNIASFHVRNGNEIILQKDNSADQFDVQVFLLGSAFGALLQQRGILPIHGSSFIVNQKAAIVCGHSGAGKSSLAAQFFKHKHQIINDDISPVQTIENKAYIQPGFPFMKLWKDSLKQLEIDYSKARKIRMQLEKFSIPLNNNFNENEEAVKFIFTLKTHNKAKLEITELKGLEKFAQLKPHIYRKNFLIGKEKELFVFQQLSGLANQVKVFEIRRPQHPFDTESIYKKINEITQ